MEAYLPTVLDLFSGAGGFSLGLFEAGFRPLISIDHNSNATETYDANFKHLGAQALLRDMGTFTPGKYLQFAKANNLPQTYDLIVGGPPCQGWSVLGRAKLRSLEAKNGNKNGDPRNQLYETFIEYVSVLQPKIAVMENVTGMLNFKGRNEAIEIAKKLSACGYQTTWTSINAKDYGVPQSRERLFFVGVRNDLEKTFEFPQSKCAEGKRRYPVVTVKEAIGDLPVIRNGSQEWIRKYASSRQSTYAVSLRKNADETTIFDHVVRNHNSQDLEAFKLLKQGGKYRDLPQHLKRYRDDIFDDKYHRLHADKPSWCVTAHLSKDCYSHIHPTQNRSISIREAARLQSFPDSFYFGGNMGNKMELIGNAVPPKIAQVIGEAIKEQFFSQKIPSLNSIKRNISVTLDKIKEVS